MTNREAPRVIRVNTERPYDVTVGRGLLPRVGEMLAAVASGDRVCLVSDDTVYALYGDTVATSLAKAGFRVVPFVFPHGEDYKTPETLFRLWNTMAEGEIDRRDTIVSLGGGVVGDLAGFAAATYLRGVSFIQIPTTLLSMVDASVGGKTAVDLPAGKNLAGAFWQPRLVVCDTDVLSTLPARTFSSGMAEVVKYAALGDAALGRILETEERPDLTEVVLCAVDDKRRFVEQDERDTGVRRLLNLGHTFGHAIEKLSCYRLSHGEAVAIGMHMVFRAAVSRGICEEKALSRLDALLCKFSLPTKSDYPPDAIARTACGDKKRAGDTVTLILPYAFGDVRPVDVPVSELSLWAAEGAKL